MSIIEQKLADQRLILPEPLQLPSGMKLPFPWVLVRGNRVYISGHGPQERDGQPAGPFGAVGESVSIDEGYEAARKVGLSILASLKRELGDLDRIVGWCCVHGMVLCKPGFTNAPAVVNGFTDLILDVFGPDIGRHARTAVGVAALPLNFPIEIEAEVLIKE